MLADTGRQSRRQRQLPARLVVYYVMALALYAQASYGEVLRCLLEGVRWLRLSGADLALADKSAITKARTRLGPARCSELFARVARPLAEPDTPGAWYRGRRLVSLDGTTIDLPDTPDLEERFGRPAASRGSSSFPQLRLLTLAETGTHAIFAVALDRYQVSEVQLAPELLQQLQPGMLCLADRAFVGFELVADGRRLGRRPALAGAQEPGPALPRAPARRLVPEPPLCLAQAPPPRGGRVTRPGHRLPAGGRARMPSRSTGWSPPCSIRPSPGRRAGGPLSRALGERGRLCRVEGERCRGSG